MTTKYIDVDSTYRNRAIWPQPGAFQLLESPSGGRSAAAAVDPVSNAAPIVEWTSNAFATTGATTFITATVVGGGIGNANSPTTIIATAPNLQTAANYYINATLQVPSHAATVTGPITTVVTAYKYLGNNIGQFTVNPAVATLAGDAVTLRDPTQLSVNALFVPTGSTTKNAYVGDYVYDETINAYLPIGAYDNATGLVTLVGSTVGWSPTDTFEIVKQPPAFVGVAGAASTTSTVVLGASAATNPNLIGSFVRLSPSGQTSRIVAYDATTTIATVSPPFTTPVAGVAYQLLLYSYDNFTPFTYVGTRQYEQLTYAVSLNRLMLPTGTLAVASGGTILDYPYVYVEFSPIDTNTTSVFNSNNPHATRALFRASNYARSTQMPTTGTATPFVRFIGDDMTQRVRFSPDTNFNFRVVMPTTGETFALVAQDSVAPAAPIAAVQLSALFQLERWPLMDAAKRLA
jgi:hypothetical protein